MLGLSPTRGKTFQSLKDVLKNKLLSYLRISFEKIREAGLKLKLSSCSFFKKHLQYVRHLISGEGIYPLKEKVASLMQLVPPTNVTKTKHTIGLVSYYRKFIVSFSDI